MRIYRLFIRVLGAVLLSAAPGLTVLPDPPSISPAGDLLRMEQKVHLYVNQERLSNRVPELNWNEQLAAESRRHARNIARNQFFAHKDPARGDIDVRLNKSGIAWIRCAENLFEGNNGDAAKEAVKAWLNSPGHHKNMMDSMFSDTGVGVAQRSDGIFVVVQAYVFR